MKHNLQRQIFLYSAIFHIMLVGSLMEVQQLLPARTPPPTAAEDNREVARLVTPPASVLRQLAPPPPTPKPEPRLAPSSPPTPPPQSDRISVGAQAKEKAKVLELKRDEELRKLMAQGDTLRRQAPAPEPPTAEVKAQAGASPQPTPSAAETAASGEKVPALGRPMLPSAGDPGPTPPPRLTAPSESIAASAERRVEALGRQGLPTGTGKQIGPLFFDPEGADFTDWVEHLRREIYRNWIVPQSAMFGFGTHADFEFVVERDGRVSAANLAKSSGVAALDRAAQNALIASRPLPLPADFKSRRLVLQISFVYNAERQG